MNHTKITLWIQTQLNDVKSKYLDGINIDIEQPIDEGSPLIRGLTTFTKRVVDSFHLSIPGSQVTFDVAWSARNIKGKGVDGRNYDYKSLGEISDFLFIMAYDEQSQMFDENCLAGPNSGNNKQKIK